MENHYVTCSCQSSQHIIKFCFIENYAEENDVCWVDIQMIQWRSFWKRIYVAIKYIFGYEEKYGHWDCTQLSRDEVEKLKKFLDRAILNLDEKNNS
jgi:hypothetical protein